MFKKLALAAAIAMVAGGASAANYTLDDLSADSPVSFRGKTTGSFDDMLSFNLIGAGADYVGFLTSTFSGSKTIGNFSAVLSGPGGYSSSWTYSADADVQTLKGTASFLSAGAYTLHVTGIGQPKDTYTLDMSVSAVPEPETYALMLAGLGALGFIAKRRKA